MILDHISHWEQYARFPQIYAALAYLRLLDTEHLPTKQVAFDNGAFLNAVTLITKPAEQCNYEAHNRFIDIHHTLLGTERIDVQDRARLLPLEELFPERDIGFYTGEAAATCLVRPGWFLVCFPPDVHRVAMAADAPEPVQKIVVKIPV